MLTERKVQTTGSGRSKHIVSSKRSWPDTRNNTAAIHQITCIDQRTGKHQTGTEQGISHARFEYGKVMANRQTYTYIAGDKRKYFTATNALLEQHGRNHHHHSRVQK